MAENSFKPTAHFLQAYVVQVNPDGSAVNPVSLASFADPMPSSGIAMGAEDTNGDMVPLKVDASGALEVAATVNASIAPFEITGKDELAVTTSSARVALPSGDPSLVLRNKGDADAFFELGDGTVTANANGKLIAANDIFVLNVGTATHLAAITASGAAELEIWTGTGLAVVSQKSEGGGSGGTVAIDQSVPGSTNAVDATNFPAVLDTNSGNKSGSTIRVVLATDQPALTTAMPVSAASLPLPTGAATAAKQPALGTAGTPSADVISIQGVVGGTNVPVSFTMPALVAGSAIIGNVRIDQTTPGTTNAVALTHIGSTAIAANSGNLSAGVQRVTLATDSVAIALWGHGARAATAPANASLVGGRAATANPTAVTDGQMAAPMLDKLGKQITVPFGPRDLLGQQLTTITNTTETTIVTAGGANVFHDLLGLKLVNSGATPVEVAIRDATGGTIVDYVYVPEGDMRGVTYSAPFKQTTANNNWTAQASGSTTSLRIIAQFVKNL